MSIPPLPKLEQAAKEIVWDAVKEGKIKELTPRLVRQHVEKRYELEEGCLDASEYKSALKSATKAALKEGPPSSASQKQADEPESETKGQPQAQKKRKVEETRSDDENDEDAPPTPKPKPKARKLRPSGTRDSGDEGTPKKKRRVSKTVKKQVESMDEDEEDREAEDPKNKGRAPKAIKKQQESMDEDEQAEEERPPPKSAKRERKKDAKSYKSLEHIPTSDMEQDEPDPVNVAGPSTSYTKPPSPVKRKKTEPKIKIGPPKSLTKKPKKSETNHAKKEEDDAKSESELSILIDDEPPKRKRKEKAEKKTEGKPKVKRTSKGSVSLSKDEETIKRLKSFVLACGARKVWSKVFQGLDTPQQQIKKLKEMLADLGMTGRMSMEQAKSIKEQRELAQELEDVQQFSKSILATGRSSRSRVAPLKKLAADDELSEDEKASGSDFEGETSGIPFKRRANARRSIVVEDSDEE